MYKVLNRLVLDTYIASSVRLLNYTCWNYVIICKLGPRNGALLNMQFTGLIYSMYIFTTADSSLYCNQFQEGRATSRCDLFLTIPLMKTVHMMWRRKWVDSSSSMLLWRPQNGVKALVTLE